jgi:hypothetical protein
MRVTQELKRMRVESQRQMEKLEQQRQQERAEDRKEREQERAQLTLQVEGLCELNKALAVKVEQQAAELRNIHRP